MAFGSFLKAAGAGSRSLMESREREQQKQMLLEDRLMKQQEVQRRRTLEEALAERQQRMDAAAMDSRSLDDELKRVQIEQARAPKPHVPRPSRTTDRGIEEFDPTGGEWTPTGRTPYQAPKAPKGPPRVTPSDKDRTADFMREGAERAERTLRNYSASPRSAISKIPGLGNYGLTETDQVAQQAAETLHDAYLRITTGATISPDELRRAARQYIAQPGDGPRVLRAKAERRAEILRAIRSASDRVRGGGGVGAEDELEAGLPNP